MNESVAGHTRWKISHLLAPGVQNVLARRAEPLNLGPCRTDGISKHLDPFQVLSDTFKVFILFLLALMSLLVRRFYKMYMAERVLRK